MDLRVDRLPRWKQEQSRIACVEGWEARHRVSPRIAEQFQRAGGEGFSLLYRGVKDDPGDLFNIGAKAKPFYMACIPDRFARNARSIIDRDGFRNLAVAFVESPMCKRGCPSTEELCIQFAASDERGRFRLAELLLYSLQYQNCRVPERWRDRLLLLSASLKPEVAIRYALSVRPDKALVDTAYVIEYAPPSQGGWYEPVAGVIDEFRELQLGEMFPDHDIEVFIPFAIFPHYVLGYAELALVPEADGMEYRVRYHPNPHFERAGVSLANPPTLSAEQRERLGKMDGQLAYVSRLWNGSTVAWSHIVDGDSHIAIAPPDSPEVDRPTTGACFFPYHEGWKSQPVECERCGWSGTCGETNVGVHQKLIDCSCPHCGDDAAKLAIFAFSEYRPDEVGE